MNPLPLTTVYLTEEELNQFLMFQKYRSVITNMERYGAFGVVNGDVTIHFGQGMVSSIDVMHRYRV